MGLPITGDTRPEMFSDANRYSRDLRVVAQEVGDKAHAEVLNLSQGLSGGERVDGILHRVSRQYRAVIALSMYDLKIAFKLNVYGDVFDFVPLPRPVDPQQPDIG